jgi:hypothetical protein
VPRRRNLVTLAVVLLVLAASPAFATFPFPATNPSPYDYTKLHINNGSCTPPFAAGNRPAGSDLPNNFDCLNDWRLSDYAARPGDADYDPTVANNPQELLGVQGPGTNRAWEVTTGRPDTVIAVMDSGIRWDENRSNVVNKFYLNRGELPVPNGTAKGAPLTAYDTNGDGLFNVKDYAGDGRVTDLNGTSQKDPQDLIRTFSDGVDDDGNGYVDDISGWDFFEGDNDANDDVDYGHGTGEAEDSAGETETNLDPQCPNCMLMMMRVGDSFVADINHFAEAVVYAVDNGASVVQEALGTLNHTAFGQAAADYAYSRGVLIVASQADESAGHHNYPAALNHTMLVNSVTEYLNESGVAIQVPKTFLSFNGCTNFGGYSWVTIASTSCSSDATAQAAGMAGLLYSAARNAVEKGVIAPGPAGRPLSAEEAKQLFRLGAQDVDFSTPKPPFGPPNNFATSIPLSQRFVTTDNWDQITGWGRLSSNTMVRLVSQGTIPPEADITSPRWWQPLPVAGKIDLIGRVAAPRAGAYTYRVEFAPGVQPPRFPGGDVWTAIGGGSGTSPRTGVLARLNLPLIRSKINGLNNTTPPYTPADDPTSRDLPEQDAFRVRVIVCAGTTPCPANVDYDPRVAIEQRQYFSRADADLLPGFPKFLQGDGAASPAFADIDGDAKDELVLADGNGFVHAYKASGAEAAGWPVHTTRLTLPATGTNGYTSNALSGTVYAPVLLGSPLVADLDRDGDLEVSVGDIEGNLHVWNANGTPRAGFPVRGVAAFSHEPPCQTGPIPACDDFAASDVKNQHNVVDQAFTANPSAGELDTKVAGLEIVAGSNDGHVYAWHADGTPVPGWPVLIREPDYVQSVDPVTHKVGYTSGAPLVRNQRKIITTPTLADVDVDGDLEVLVNANEQYEETPNWSGRDVLLNALGQVLAFIGNAPGNTRTYMLHHDGFKHFATTAQKATPHPHDQAYVTGWPVPIAMVQTDLLPYVGEGSNGSPVAAQVDGTGPLEIATASIGSPPYLLKWNGQSVYGSDPNGDYLTMASNPAEFKSAATDGPAIASLGGGAFGNLGAGLSFAMGSTGLRRLLDVVLPEQQLLGEDHLGVWDARTGTYAPGFPAQMNDLMFFNSPAIADVTGDGRPEALQASAMYDLRAYGLAGVQAFNKFTGGWGVMTPAVGDLDGDGLLELAYATREGNLFVWRTPGQACAGQEWPKYQHDLRNTGTHGVDARPPSRILNLTGPGIGRTVTWTATGDDMKCGRATSYDVRAAAVPVTDANWATATQLRNEPVPGLPGTTQTYNIGLASGTWYVAIEAIDEAGNRSQISPSVLVVIP